MLLAGDIGGTKTNLAIVTKEAGPRAPLAEATLPSGDFAGLADLCHEFLKSQPYRPTHASFGVAGPVMHGSAKVTNLPWQLDEADLARDLGLESVHLLNDLLAVANAIPHLLPGDLHTINPGKPAKNGAIGVIAPGTGLGEAYLTHDGTRYHAWPSEGGHADFAPATPVEIELLQFLKRQMERVSYERVCSGRFGIPNLYAFLKERNGEEPEVLARTIAEAGDPARAIVAAAMEDNPPQIAADTLAMFVDILVAEAGNLALRYLATGGMYIGGGIPPRILKLFSPEVVRPVYGRRGRLSPIVEDTPLHVITNSDIGLVGAASAGLLYE